MGGITLEKRHDMLLSNLIGEEVRTQYGQEATV